MSDAVLTYILNLTDSERHYNLQSQNSPQKIVFYAQLINITKQDLLEAGDEFMSRFNAKLISACQKYDFNTSGQGYLLQNLLELQIFLNSQQEKEVVNNDFLNSLRNSLKNGQEGKLKKILHFYLSYACKFGYHKQVREKLNEDYHSLLPDQDILRPTFENVKARLPKGEEGKTEENFSDGAT